SSRYPAERGGLQRTPKFPQPSRSTVVRASLAGIVIALRASCELTLLSSRTRGLAPRTHLHCVPAKSYRRTSGYGDRHFGIVTSVLRRFADRRFVVRRLFEGNKELSELMTPAFSRRHHPVAAEHLRRRNVPAARRRPRRVITEHLRRAGLQIPRRAEGDVYAQHLRRRGPPVIP